MSRQKRLKLEMRYVRYDEDKLLNKEEVIEISKEMKFIQYFDE